MALRFISHREIAFRQLLGMLRTPPVAVMNYYTNLFLSARFVFGEQPDKIRKLDKEVRRVECMVGVKRTPDSDAVQRELLRLNADKNMCEAELQRIEGIYHSSNEQDKKQLEMDFRELQSKMDRLENQEYQLLFRLTPLMPLKQIETYMDNNMDLKSFFKEHGRLVTQMELNSELDQIKVWVYQEAVEMMPYIRFTKLE